MHIVKFKSKTLFIAMCISLAFNTQLCAQQRVATNQSEEARQNSPVQNKDDVIVIGQSEPAITPTVPIKERTNQLLTSRQAASGSQRFARCIKRVDPKLVRESIEGLPHRYDSEYALDRLIREEQTCYGGLPISPMPLPPYFGACNPISYFPQSSVCRSFFDRGALIERTLRKYAPTLSFHDGDLTNPLVLERFKTRNAVMNQTRYNYERIGYAVVACAVATHPAEALALVRSQPGSRTEERARLILLGQSPQCLGGAKKITTDGPQFRVYLAETVYFFAAALLNVDSLIPKDAARE